MWSLKYVTLFLANFDSPYPLSHFVTHPGTPPNKIVRHTSRTPRFLVYLVQKTGQKPPVQILSQLFVGVFVQGVCQGVFCLEGFVWVVFVHSPFCQNTSVTTER